MIAISTAFTQAIVAIDICGKQDFAILDGNHQSENILKTIDSLLSKNGLTISDNDCYAVVTGPGSFTGLRVGASLVKGLCAGSKNQCKVVGISSLSLLAREYLFNHKPKGDFACVLNALSGLVFVCSFDRYGNKLEDERLIEKSELDKQKIAKVGLKGEHIVRTEIQLIPQSLLQEANKMLEEKKYVDPKTFSPLYLRKSQAEVSLEEKEKKLYKKL